MQKWLARFSGTKWKGKGELWQDPEGNTAEVYDCELAIENDIINYSWIYNNETWIGRFTFSKNAITWTDSWHQKSTVECFSIPNAWGVFTLNYEYKVPDNPNWGWRTKLSERPDSSLVLQMTNIAPWGEEGRAVRMVFNREQA